MYKIARQRDRTRISKHTHDLLVEHGGITEFAFDGEVEQFFIRDRVPKKERKVRCEFEIADRVGSPARNPVGTCSPRYKKNGLASSPVMALRMPASKPPSFTPSL